MRRMVFPKTMRAVYSAGLWCGQFVGGWVCGWLGFPHTKLNNLVVHNSTILPYAPLAQSYAQPVALLPRSYPGLIPGLHRRYLLLLLVIYKEIMGSNGGWKMYKNEDNGWEARSVEL
jgi:hypothetical protein